MDGTRTHQGWPWTDHTEVGSAYHSAFGYVWNSPFKNSSSTAARCTLRKNTGSWQQLNNTDYIFTNLRTSSYLNAKRLRETQPGGPDTPAQWWARRCWCAQARWAALSDNLLRTPARSAASPPLFPGAARLAQLTTEPQPPSEGRRNHPHRLQKLLPPPTLLLPTAYTSPVIVQQSLRPPCTHPSGTSDRTARCATCTLKYTLTRMTLS